MSAGNHAKEDHPVPTTLWHSRTERSSCGVGFVTTLTGTPSHKILETALSCVCALSHRGAVDADMKTGDGAGVMTQVPAALFRKDIEKWGAKLYRDDDLAVGFCFLPPDDAYVQAHCRKLVQEALAEHGLFVFGWRKVPVHRDALGEKAARTCPEMEQVLIGKPEDRPLSSLEYERTLYLCRKKIEGRIARDGVKDFHIPSLSSRTIVYKGLFVSPQLPKFYRDLRDPDFQTALAVYHQRYSTNTFPAWRLAQPFRVLGHNGEINTILGNRLWMRAREKDLSDSLWVEEAAHLAPVLLPAASDSAHLDNAVELLLHSGYDLLHTMLMLVPAAWQAEPRLSPEERAFYEYHELLSEPWDGPAALVFSDGRTVGACLDRNGLRPIRYKITEEGTVVLGSEVGIGGLEERTVVEKGRLGPGEIIAVDTVSRRLLRSPTIKKSIADRHPYGEWLSRHSRRLASTGSAPTPAASREPASLSELLAFGYDEEEIKQILKPMAEKGEEGVGSMGDDAPPAVLSREPRILYWYFRQLFAQVTNPPIDPLRERLVMSLEMWVGRRPNPLERRQPDDDVIRLTSPFLTYAELAQMRNRHEPSLQARTISCLFPAGEGVDGFLRRLSEIRVEAEEAVKKGFSILVLSDRGVSPGQAALPMLLVVGAVHHHLIRAGTRIRASLVCETGECRDVHHFACLIGFGATAVNPYLALQLLADLAARGELKAAAPESAQKNYRKAVEKGLLKILSKMGISTLWSYHGAQVFEALGLGAQVIEECFEGVVSHLGGVGYPEIAQEALARHAAAFAPASKLPDRGHYRYRREGERHAVTPLLIQSVHTFVGLKGRDKAFRYEDYRKIGESLATNLPLSLRDCLRFRPQEAVPLSEVEPIEEIRRRFTTAGMSLGALSPEAHETLALALNRIGGKSNTGEGGEDRARFVRLPNGDSLNSAIKQVASGRFGVTAEYLASASEIEIKMAQGSKPGEGGQLPGHKVTALIARLRRSTPGVMLISPPPHHDIYSIEDLAQLIYDLKQVNPRARVCVKLVSEAGVGAIAAGVVKAHADVVLISGHDGGTGASPLSSIKYAGSPWEIGLAETQRVLLTNGLRSRVTLRTDGGIRTGRDIVIGGLLGAEEFNFGTMALIALGCVYVRQCHLNTCPTGIATQDERLRGKFRGTPEGLIAYFDAVSQEVREILASLGARTFNEIIGRADLLEPKEIPDHPKANRIDLRPLLSFPGVGETEPRFHTWERNDPQGDRPLDDILLLEAKSAIHSKEPIELRHRVRNVHRSIGAGLSGEIAYHFGDEGLPEGTIRLRLSGTAGQSLGAFLVKGIAIHLEGEANDYVGKGMSGGEIVLVPPAGCHYRPEEAVICGNTVLYGATGGRLFVRGKAGERFAVRNSGALAVVEGIGDHGCEYMTGGVVAVLGPTGKNFGAGMSGGLAYVFDEDGCFEERLNPEMVRLERVTSPEDQKQLQELLDRHLEKTGSSPAERILREWERFRPLFWKVVPLPPSSAPTAAPEPERKQVPAAAAEQNR
ncbi:Ferredoxin-dependent glutamate synthase 2 [Methylacidimicrobium sp. AP8]|uniref:glutamate synthase large subunit n=1 Tax=Methylacidimicrobium sp. AP8 TaxID=2730359 RepID=UPI0018C0AF4F|nr:glutamate synthase large subunit [Methylacidimicrobium sp. AP8]CAB4244325.1 Ferredoxin-dependent glutamate synthase 2 [Methylacidimicrobium sp. AP8]